MSIFGPGKNVAYILIRLPMQEEGRTYEFERLVLWAEPKLEKTLQEVSGVMLASVENFITSRYVIGVDPRYDLEYVINEIKAVSQEAALQAARGLKHGRD